MKRIFGGIDIRRYTHHMIIIDEKEQILYQRDLLHQLGEIKETMKQLKSLQKKMPSYHLP
ncbi:MAG: hypothetical protein KBI07_00040 [Candidatus Atribacteria bacterium]|nr:hypothetical protein [Candidatus Atribacteria bacterium]